MYAMTPTRMLATFSVTAALCLCAFQTAPAQRFGRMRMAPAGFYHPQGQRAQARMQAPPHMQQGPPPRRPAQGMGGPGGNRAQAPRGEHLGQWMDAHKNLSPEQQQRALTNEPGFRQLPPQTQQRLLNHLSQLNAMNPQQRGETARNVENMERLNPQQRGQVRGAMQQLGSLPPDQRQAVSRSFRQLRDLPPDQRGGAMSRIPLNDAQRSTLNNLMQVEPLLPPVHQQPH
jgi:hypothetical protein